MEKLSYQWKAEDRDQRVDKVLAARLSVSRAQIQDWLKKGLVVLEEAPEASIAARSRVFVGQTLLINVPPVEPMTIAAASMNLNILYEDRDLIVINKAPGQVVHPGAGHREGTLVSGLLHHCKKELSGIGGVERPGIVHRLDKETSGVLVVAKNDKTHLALSAQFKDREVEKFYSAFVIRCPGKDSGRWEGEIGRHPVQRKKMTILPSGRGGRSARTDFRVLEKFERLSYLEFQLHTGRTHQIRVHCAKAKCPVAGDKMYGGNPVWLKELEVSRCLLHSFRLAFVHPGTGKRLEIEAPLPDDFKKLRKQLRK